MGTCRMGNSPRNSVIDKYHQAWDIPNLFICDGSAMTTGGACNPDHHHQRAGLVGGHNRAADAIQRELTAS